jgi:nucleoside-diphosphate-sugar epimerase
LRGDSNENFVGKIENLVPFIEKSSVNKVVFVSSTGVYADSSSLSIVTENDLPIPETESGKQLSKVESLLLENSSFESIIIRFGGLIGEDRHPIKFLAGRKNIENPDGPVNLIHQKDCIGIIETMLQKKEDEKVIWNQVYNAVYPYHPSRKEYYTEKALEQNLALPEFSVEKPSVGKTISSIKIEEELHYKFVKKV